MCSRGGAGLTIIGVSLPLVAAVSRYLSGTPLTPAILVVAIGVVVGPLCSTRSQPSRPARLFERLRRQPLPLCCSPIPLA